MLEVQGEDFTPLLRVWFGDVEAETIYRYIGCSTFGVFETQVTISCIMLKNGQTYFNPLMPGGNKRSCVLKQTCSFKYV